MGNGKTGEHLMRLGRVAVLMVITSTILLSCSPPAHFTISDAESIGFVKGDQQFFTMIGAVDGWSGTFDGETVELYEYRSASDIPTDVFDNFVASGNPSGWAEYCTVGNLAMVSKGTSACRSLRTLSR